MDFLGNFETEKIIAKNASRRGLSFSTTCDAGEIPFVTKIEDFKTEDENYTFSDGGKFFLFFASYSIPFVVLIECYIFIVGICTAIIAHDSAIALRKSNIKPGQISAVQFRLGGAKGELYFIMHDRGTSYTNYINPRCSCSLAPSTKRFFR